MKICNTYSIIAFPATPRKIFLKKLIEIGRALYLGINCLKLPKKNSQFWEFERILGKY